LAIDFHFLAFVGRVVVTYFRSLQQLVDKTFNTDSKVFDQHFLNASKSN